MGKGSLTEYMGVRREPKDANNDTYKGSYQIVPILAYYDIFKNYYANKQEERFYVMGGSLIQNAITITATDFIGEKTSARNDTLICTTPSTVTITGTDLKIEKIKQIKFTIDTNPIYIYVDSRTNWATWEIISTSSTKIVIKSIVGNYYRTTREIQGRPQQSIELKGATENISQGTVTEAYTSSFPLTEIDDLREYILSKGREQIRVVS